MSPLLRLLRLLCLASKASHVVQIFETTFNFFVLFLPVSGSMSLKHDTGCCCGGFPGKTGRNLPGGLDQGLVLLTFQDLKVHDDDLEQHKGVTLSNAKPPQTTRPPVCVRKTVQTQASSEKWECYSCFLRLSHTRIETQLCQCYSVQ